MTTNTEIEPMKIGTVEVKVPRLYPLDGRSPYKNEGTWIIVEAGAYDVYQEMDAVYIMFRGHATAHGLRKMGDGLFFGQTGDQPVGVEHVFSSPVWGLQQFIDFTNNDPLCKVGPAQRLKFDVTLDVA